MGKAKDPRARLEFVDVATGEARRPEPPGRPVSDGTAPTGRIVADIEGEEVEVDEEDLIGSAEGEHPREQTYRYDFEALEEYRQRARAQAARRAAARAAELKKPRAFRETFDSAKQAAREFYDANALYFDNVRDPIDGLRDWADGIDVRTGKQATRRLVNTAAGRRILQARPGEPQTLAALQWVFNQAKGRRWDAVPWEEVDRLEEALQPHYEAPSEREAGTPGLYWRPVVGTATAEQLDALAPEQREQLAEWESAKEVRATLEELREAFARNLDCLTPSTRRIVRRRIAEWNRWARDPSEIPEYACEPDEATGGYTCNYPSVAGELRELRRACERDYDPDWAEPEGRAGEPGFPDLTRGPDDPRVEPERPPLRQLEADGRAYGAPESAIVEVRKMGEVVYQLEYRTCGKRNPKTGRPWCSCFAAWPEGGHGPYWYAYWREPSGRRRSQYIGKAFREI